MCCRAGCVSSGSAGGGTRLVMVTSLTHRGGRLDFDDLQVIFWACGSRKGACMYPQSASGRILQTASAASPTRVHAFTLSGRPHACIGLPLPLLGSLRVRIRSPSQARQRYTPLKQYADSKLAVVMAVRSFQRRFDRCANERAAKHIVRSPHHL